MAGDRLQKQLDFIREADKLKNIHRRTLLMDGKRYENGAEHSWHVSLMAFLLAEYANGPVDICKVVRMLVFHDLVEIYAGDTFCYDEKGALDQKEREADAADRLFALLPAEQAEECRQVWEEFDARLTTEAKFAAALDRLHPLLHNYATGGAAWREHGVSSDRVIEKNRHIDNGSHRLWDYAKELIRDSMDRGYFA